MPPNTSSFNIDPYRFQTLRYRHYNDHIIGKSLIDIAKYNLTDDVRVGIHKVLPDCNHPTYGHDEDWMHFNHYSGSWEAYQRPNDIRSKENRRLKWYKISQNPRKRLKSCLIN